MNEEEQHKRRPRRFEKISRKMTSWQKEQSDMYKVYIKTSAVGLEFALSIALGTLLGYFADKYFESAPYGLLIGLAIGTVAAVKRLWIFTKKYLQKDDKDNE